MSRTADVGGSPANFTSVVDSCLEAASTLRESGGGSIVTGASPAGAHVQTDGKMAFSCASKAAAVNYARALAAGRGPDGVRVNALAPGLVWTPRVAAEIVDQGIAPSALARYQRVALGRWGTADAIAKVVLFLVSDLERG